MAGVVHGCKSSLWEGGVCRGTKGGGALAVGMADGMLWVRKHARPRVVEASWGLRRGAGAGVGREGGDFMVGTGHGCRWLL